MKFTFKNDHKLRAVARTALKGRHKLPYGQGSAGRKGVWLVKDEGVYVMPANGVKRRPCYAEGFGEDTWLGGDDFAEFIPLSDEQIGRIVHSSMKLDILLTDTSIKVTA